MFLSTLVSWWPRLRLGGALVALALIASVSGPAGAGAEGANHLLVSGAGRTIIEGGTGGAFECLALAPGSESGSFEVNAMYVTGTVSSATVTGNTAVLHGTATVTGLGAGHNVPFTATVQAGGPGTTVVLEISGLTFHEILLEGQIRIAES